MTNTELKREHPKFSHPQSIVPGVSAGNILESHEPHGVPMKDMWSHQKDHMQLVSTLNRRKFEVLVVGTGLSAGAAAAALGELGYKVKVFTYHDSPRRAHSIAAQGGDPRPFVEGSKSAYEMIVNAFAAHLDLERGRSEHTVRAYRREAAALLAHLREVERIAPAEPCMPSIR